MSTTRLLHWVVNEARKRECVKVGELATLFGVSYQYFCYSMATYSDFVLVKENGSSTSSAGPRWLAVPSRSRILTYDYREGYVVNSETDKVVERVFDYSPPGRSTKSYEEPRGSQRGVQVVSKRYYRDRNLYAKARRLERGGLSLTALGCSALASSGA
jgi:hypothetical protein